MAKHQQKAARDQATAQTPQFRSAAVARMTLMPVATLRVWEQRYQAVSPVTKASGHRLYDLADVQRVLLLRQLTQQGHAISALAPLHTEQLQALVGQHADLAQAMPIEQQKPAGVLRVVVVGQALAERLRRPATAPQGGELIELVAQFATLSEAVQAASSNRKGTVDALIWQSAGLQPSPPTELEAAREAWAVNQVVVVYRFAGAAARKAFSDTGALLIHDKANDPGLGAALTSLVSRVKRRQGTSSAPALQADADRSSPRLAVSAAPRRFSDEVLSAFAAIPSASTCECPRHVAELLMQIASFESYSADCASRNQEDAEIHAQLHQVAGIARQLFETAIEAVARHEGLTLR